MLNQKICLSESANTGFGECVIDVKNIVGMILTPPNTEIAEEDIEDLGAYLNDKVNADDPAERFYPVHDFEEIANNTEDVQIQTLGYGGKAVTREGDYDFTLRFLRGAMCLHKSLRKFNGVLKDIFLIDANGLLLGSAVNGKLRSIPLTLLYVPPFGLNDGSATANYGIRVSFKPSHINENLGFVDTQNLGLVLSTFKGLMNLVLQPLAVSAFPVVTIRVVTGCDIRNIFDTYSDELAAPEMWNAYLKDGTELTITSVTANDGAKAFTVTVTDGEDNNFTEFYLELASPTALNTAGVVGFEGKRVLIKE